MADVGTHISPKLALGALRSVLPAQHRRLAIGDGLVRLRWVLKALTI